MKNEQKFRMTLQFAFGPESLRYRYSGRNVPAWYQARMGWIDAIGKRVYQTGPHVLLEI